MTKIRRKKLRNQSVKKVLEKKREGNHSLNEQ